MNDQQLRIVVNAKDNASAVIKKVRGEFKASTDTMDRDMERAKLGAQRMASAIDKAFLVAGAAVAGLAYKAAGAAFDQVRQVENASFALRAYEKDAGKVSDVLADLVKFARSDMGVLFQRQDLFKAASNLKGFGEETSRLTDRVEILARGVSLGMTTFDELSQIVGRATQAGTLAAEEYDMLASRGIILDKSFRSAAVSSEALYEELSRVLPEELLKDRAETIDGVFIRLQSAFRDVGSAILDVDANTSKFVEGGLGDRLIDGFERLREVMASPAFKQGVSDFVNNLISIGKYIAENVMPQLVPLVGFIADNTWVIVALAAAFAAVRTAMFLAGAIEAFSTVMAGVRAVSALTAGSQGIGLMTGALKGFSVLAATPIVMPALVVTAALASLAKVYSEGKKLQGLLDEVTSSAQGYGEGRGAFVGSLGDALRSGRIDRTEYDRRLNAYNAGIPANLRATGGPVSAGQPYVVGEKRAEMFVPNTQGRIQPSVPSSTGTVHNILSGTFNFHNQESVDTFFDRLDKTQRLARIGMAG